MNRNVNSHFSQLPQADIQRSIFDRSSSHKTSFNVGQLVPLYVDEILPGDTVNLTMSKVVRLQTLLSPIFDNLYFDTYWFFVPNRLVWDHWQEFCGENNESAWAPKTVYTVPKLKSPDGGFKSGTLADYMGLPLGVDFKSGKHLPSALPFRAYAKIVNDFFRDENLQDPVNIPTGDANQDGTNSDHEDSSYINDLANGGAPFIAAKYHDYFTSCLPSPQKGTSPTIKIGSDFVGGDFPVYSSSKFIDSEKFYPNYPSQANYDQRLQWKLNFYKNDSSGNLDATMVSGDSMSVEAQLLAGQPLSNFPKFSNHTGPNGQSAVESGIQNTIYPLNLWANVPSQSLSGKAIDINDLRLAFAAQRFLEKNARGGTRYVELLQSHFGVTSPDARLQRPEYLGGNRIRLNVSAVSNTAQNTANNDFLGDLGANSVTSDVHFDVNKSFVEHGILMCVGVVRYDHTYSQGLERFWMRQDTMDFYYPVFANIGEQPVYTDEIYYQNKDEEVFGYQEAWADYRYKPSRLSGEMRPGIPNTLEFWHLGDNYDKAPTLSDEWIREDKTNVDRVLAVSSKVSNQLFGDFYFSLRMTRPMPMFSIPGLLDHN